MAHVRPKSPLPANLHFALLAFVLLVPAAMVRAQVSSSSSSAPATFSIESSHPQFASLDGLWHFHPGDDPGWADPNFDDLHWPLIRSDKAWNEQGYPHTFGYAWYRFTFEQPDGSRPLDLLLTWVGTSYEVYADGKLIGSKGSPAASRDPVAFLKSEIFPIPTGSAGPRTIHVAVRVWAYEPVASWWGAGLHRPGNEMGDPALLKQHLALQHRALALNFVNEYGYGLFALLVGITILALFLFHPADREYLWFGVGLLAEAVNVALHVTLNLGSIPIVTWRFWGLITGAIAGIASLMFFSIILHVRRSLSWWIACAGMAAAPLTAALIYFEWTSIGTSYAAASLLRLPAQVWILTWLAVCAARKDVTARLLLVPAVLRYGIDLYTNAGRILWQLTGNYRVLDQEFYFAQRPFPLSLGNVIYYIFILALLIFLVRRFSLARQQETRLSNEMEAARSIQALLVPATAPSTPRFAVETVYLPAHEVGGDFFQIIPNKADGSLLLVAGDVSGKGLPAGMLVALLVGAIRTASDATTDPLRILEALNTRLLGRGDAKATCLALHIEADGSATLANAGHLPPYLNGAPVEMEGALPLGILAGAEFSVTRFKLNAQDRLMLISDGIAEATDKSGNLFGFERVQDLLKTAKSAAEVAAAGQAFGQEDDISVISVLCTGRPAAAV